MSYIPIDKLYKLDTLNLELNVFIEKDFFNERMYFIEKNINYIQDFVKLVFLLGDNLFNMVKNIKIFYDKKSNVLVLIIRYNILKVNVIMDVK